MPRNIGCLSKLEEFYIGDNPIKGTLPTSLGNISTLRNLYCGSNRLEGPIPLELGKLSKLRQLTFSNNYNLIATTGLHLPNLKQLLFGENQLEGEIPLFITNASKLEILDLQNNFLTGTIPNDLGNLRELRHLFLSHNQLTNEPREHELQFFNSLADCRMLRYLQVSSNPLNGVLPNSIGNLSSTIENFHIGNAHISGFIPASTGNMSGLMCLNFEENNLTGSIPSDVGKLKQLQGLYLANNKLQGHIAEVVCPLSKLVELTLNDNELIGVIPECIGNLSMLQDLWLGSNKFSPQIPLSIWKMSGLLYLHMSQNSLEGEVPTNIEELKALVELDLSGNRFSGKVPSTFGELQNLKSLNLSNNSFFGQIPLSFANLISLEFLDLSLNALSGTIPKSLEKLAYLKSINVSFNDLEGEIPSGGVFENSTLQSFLGNKGLCGMHILEVLACAISNTGQQSKSTKLVLKIVIPVITSSFLIFLFVLVWIMKRQKKGKSKDVEKVPEIRTYQLVSYHEIQRATNNFDGSNLIGVGGSGSVYKGTLSSGTAVAIKVLDLENEQVCKRFDTECEVMRNVRHRNLVPVITTCSSEYIRAFVLQYMPNGSLENWLYKEYFHLDLLQRVTVMLDAAMAIEYLHHGNDSPIVHCDLKPANVLLDEDMVAHVGDFGISKILAVRKSMAHTKTLGTLGYIAPEYGSEGIVSTSGDVYSYGIMLMEVLVKRRPTDEEIFNENLGLREWIRRAYPRTMMEVVDANLFPAEEQITSKSEICIASMIELALDCTKETPESRITMKNVVKRLNKIKNTFLEIAESNDSGKKKHSSIISRTISASKLCRCDALGSQIDSDALVSLERKSSVKHSPSEKRIDRHLIMREQMQKLEEELRDTRENLRFVEEEKKRAINELSEMKHEAHEANAKVTDGISPRKSSELYAEVRTLKELLTNKREELKIKDKSIKSLKKELEKAKKCDLNLLEKDSSVGKVKEGFSHVKAFKVRVTDWLSDFRGRVQELEDELENRKLSESKIFDAWLSKTRQFEQIKSELEESKLEIASLHEKIESLDTCSKQNGSYLNHSCDGEIVNLVAKENEKISSSKAKALNDEMSLLKNEMKLANEAEEKSRKALDDLALALKEVASEAFEAKEKLSAAQLESALVKKEAANIKEMIKSTKVRYQKLLDEAKKETELYRNTAERLKLEAEESFLAWNGKEMSFIACIKEAQEERDLAMHETTKLNESVKAAREENFKLRDILKQAINEANAAKAAADLARQENSQLKDCLTRKERINSV
ncbi:hypothetical protein HAX54_018220 [Datura stramonium]|uniref:Protein kinase domain-containing protein n=1 Tax=Datura stramonium TaxID=4076 RepID=A0ABS8UP16_DATST|nr:hypothetical protein [Datura stramonium]